MNARTAAALLLCSLCLPAAARLFAQGTATPPVYRDPRAPVEERVRDLLGRMTLEEKIAQLQCIGQYPENRSLIPQSGIGSMATVLRRFTASVAAEKNNVVQSLVAKETRLGIPVLIHDEGLHGVIANGATSFPQAIALASTFDTTLMGEVATVIAQEARSRGIRQLLSPVINIARDARWGRVEESYGEDPLLTSRMGVAFCSSLEREGVVATPKHYVANVGDGGRDSYPIEYSERLLREVYLPPFKACFQEGHATSVMAAYNALDGLPCSANHWLLTDLLRDEWHFRGFVVSDYGSVGGILDAHHTAATKEDGARQAVEAGLDVELPGIYLYGDPLLRAVKEGNVPVATIDRAASRVLDAKFRLGLFDRPDVDPASAGRINDSREHRLLALRAARKAIVLLKNDGGVLPLARDLKTLAVIGPAADVVRLGGYSGFGVHVVTPLEGIKRMVSGGTNVKFEKGCDLISSALPPVPADNLRPAGGAQGAHGLKGEYFNNMNLSGAPALVRIDPQVQFDWNGRSPDPKIQPERFSVRWTGKLLSPASREVRLSVTTDDGARLYVDGKLVIDSWHDRGASSDIVTLRLEAGKEYDIRFEYYQNGGGASASFGWEFRPDDNKPLNAAVEAARGASAALVFVGINEGEGADRSNLDLPGEQEALITAVAETGVPTVVVLVNGSAVTMSRWVNRVSGIVEEWYGGEEGGTALAEVLFGQYNPGAKLPITFPQSVGQVPLYYDHKPTGRGDDYVDLSGKPQFPFGFGLSYTRFDYSNLTITPSRPDTRGSVSISVDVTNAGNRTGDEVVQLYLHDGPRSVTRPVEELKGFQRVTLEPGAKRTVTFTLGPADFAFLDARLHSVVEPGPVDVFVGSSSEDIRQKGTFEIIAH
ncbi:MAG TPA: glycoside hydrolase family 3 N-terminal domain-containing protein [Bacteroidota bacterium]|nr:glycoside hydrolase family 3 N-terminal domain-containing protein [Bacteroidota bacterium]